MNHPHDLLIDYLTGDLSDADAQRVAAHLETCAACRAELARMDEAFVAMVESLPAEAPPERVWGAIAARTGATGADARAPAATETTVTGGAPPEDALLEAAPGDEARPPAGRGERPVAPPRDAAAPPPPVLRAPPRPRRAAWASGLAACLVLAVAAAWWGFDQRQQLQQLQADLDRLQSAQATLADDQARIARWLSEDGVVTRQIAEAEASPIGSVSFLPNGRALVIMRSAPGEASDFQAWGVRGDTVTSLGAFGGRTAEVEAEGFEAVAISLEPDGGSETPSEVLGAVPVPAP